MGERWSFFFLILIFLSLLDAGVAELTVLVSVLCR